MKEWHCVECGETVTATRIPKPLPRNDGHTCRIWTEIKKETKMKQLSDDFIGDSLSWGTLRQEDLIPSFMNFLHNVKEQCNIVDTVNEIQEKVDELEFDETPGYSGPYYINPEDANFILNEDIFYLLSEIAPEFTYFGSSEGDGSDFGFWTNDESLREHVMDELDTILQNDASLDEINNELENLISLLGEHL